MNIRLYNFEQDPPKIVQTLYTKYNTPKGIIDIKQDDKILRESPNDNVRFVLETNSEEIISSVVTMRDSKDSSVFGLYSLVTHEKYRGVGVTNELVNYCVSWIKNHGGKKICTKTGSTNIPAQRFLGKFGFQLVGKTDSNYYYELLL